MATTLGVWLKPALSNEQVHGDRPIGEAAYLVSVREREVSLFVRPEERAARRGTLAQGATALVHARQRGSGCKGAWLLVGPSAWACDAPGAFEHHAAGDPAAVTRPAPRYARIGSQGALAYSSVDRAAQQLPDAELQPGFFVGVIEERRIGGESFARTTHDIWIVQRELVPIVPSSFEGVELDAGSSGAVTATDTTIQANVPTGAHLSHGWVYVERATPRKGIAGPKLTKPIVARLTRVRIHEVRRTPDAREWYRADEGWFSDQQVRVPRIATPPDGIAANERWLDVDKTTQTLVAYVGQSPVFATLVSTGRGPEGSETATPIGVHRIWVKLTSTDMDNLGDEDPAPDLTGAQPLYAVEAVPFVMFFFRGYGLHATYWHDGFGMPKSHGCVNLSQRDASRLFAFASPKLSPGWQAVHPFEYDPGTVVRVR